jgi:hypothetical protein
LIHSVDRMKIDWTSALDKLNKYQDNHKDIWFVMSTF